MLITCRCTLLTHPIYIQVYRFLVRYYGDAGEKAEAASVAYFGGRQASCHNSLVHTLSFALAQ